MIDDIYNFRRIDDSLCTSGQPTEAQLAAVAGDGVDVVINLALHDDPRYSLADETGTVRSLGMDYVHIPVRFDAPAESDFLKFCAAMRQYAGKKILVHCAANMRVSAFLGLYRVIEQGWSKKEAFALMDSLWEPNAVWSVYISNMLENNEEK